MRCSMCGAQMIEGVGSHAYRSLPGITLMNIPVADCPNCGEHEIGIPNVDQLNALLRDRVVKKKARMTGHEVRFLRKFMGMGKDDLGQWLGVSEEKIAAWESGQEQIPAAMDLYVRLLALRGAPVEDYPTPDQVALTQPQGTQGELRFLQRWETFPDLTAVSV